ncbi:class I SAM-dependent methyltransferase [Lacinutrix sp. MedPE-SW]|uniref:class I SAM-dependent methyltransferase n=1 Tax=Lacinutrix sp. MedPE-SW TaxID=1860087 RepID=UPI000AEB531C|nr:class I SAM-dependent methyltransferase [Lacinutrix sp. MedPE-SW]
MKTPKPKKNKKAWPTKDAMDQVYKMNLWGNNNSAFYSGEGSHKPEIIEPYIKVVTAFLKAFKTPLVICDLGCGDFNIGRQLVAFSKKYYAIDIVQDLIHYNKDNFKLPNLEFKCLDIAKDNLPKGDCVLIRQVLQHLSNKEVENIANKLSNYKYVIITEHLPDEAFVPNKDIISGQGTRLKKQSGIDLLASPFNLKIEKKTEMLRITLEEGKGVIVTYLYNMF